MKGQKVRGVPQWGKFKQAVRDIEDFAKNQKLPKCYLESLHGQSMVIENVPKFYVPQISNLVDKKDFVFADDEYINLPYPMTALLTESWVVDENITKEQKQTTNINYNSWKITLFFQKEKNSGINLTSIVYSPEERKWMAYPIMVHINKISKFKNNLLQNNGSLSDSNGFSYGMGFVEDEATVKFLKSAHKSGSNNLNVISDYNEDVNALISLYKLLNVNGIEKIKVNVPEKLIKKHSKNNVSSDYSYHVLKIGDDVWDSPYVMENKVSGSGKRSHLRRGHIRKLKNKNVWVRSSYVNGSNDGFVEKDYEFS